MRRLLLSAFFVACCAAAASAQSSNKDDYPKIEFFAGYSVLGEINADDEEVDAGLASTKGFHTSLIGNFNKYLGIKGDFSLHFDSDNGPITLPAPCSTPPCPLVTQDFSVKTRLYNFLAGPEIKARNRTRLTPFAHALFGVAHGSVEVNTSGTALNLNAKNTDTGFAMAFGGGLDIRATRRVSFRALMDYNPAFIGETDTGERKRFDHVRLSIGILFR